MNLLNCKCGSSFSYCYFSQVLVVASVLLVICGVEFFWWLLGGLTGITSLVFLSFPWLLSMWSTLSHANCLRFSLACTAYSILRFCFFLV